MCWRLGKVMDRQCPDSWISGFETNFSILSIKSAFLSGLLCADNISGGEKDGVFLSMLSATSNLCLFLWFWLQLTTQYVLNQRRGTRPLPNAPCLTLTVSNYLTPCLCLLIQCLPTLVNTRITWRARQNTNSSPCPLV